MKKLQLLLVALFVVAFADAQTTIAAADAAKHIGDSVTICDKIAGVKYFENAPNGPTLLSVGADYPNQQLTVVIFKAQRDKLSFVPEDKLLNQYACITGRLQLYKGKPEIVVQQESQLKRSENNAPNTGNQQSH